MHRHRLKFIFITMILFKSNINRKRSFHRIDLKFIAINLIVVIGIPKLQKTRFSYRK